MCCRSNSGVGQSAAQCECPAALSGGQRRAAGADGLSVQPTGRPHHGKKNNYKSHDALPVALCQSLLGLTLTQLLLCLNLTVISSSVLRDADSRPRALSAPVPAGRGGGRPALHILQLDPSGCRGGGQSKLHRAGPGAWRTHPDLHSEDAQRKQRHPGEEAQSGGAYMISCMWGGQVRERQSIRSQCLADKIFPP